MVISQLSFWPLCAALSLWFYVCILLMINMTLPLSVCFLPVQPFALFFLIHFRGSYFTHNISQFVACLHILFMVPFDEQNFF